MNSRYFNPAKITTTQNKSQGSHFSHLNDGVATFFRHPWLHRTPHTRCHCSAWLPKWTPEHQPKAVSCCSKLVSPGKGGMGEEEEKKKEKKNPRHNTRQQDGFKSRNSKQRCSARVCACESWQQLIQVLVSVAAECLIALPSAPCVCACQCFYL